jgi:hypothetical protein
MLQAGRLATGQSPQRRIMLLPIIRHDADVTGKEASLLWWHSRLACMCVHRWQMAIVQTLASRRRRASRLSPLLLRSSAVSWHTPSVLMTNLQAGRSASARSRPRARARPERPARPRPPSM